MGMAASQARYLALTARKSNCEFEGQQINQARTALANQSANLFNQMLGLNVPVPPSTQEFTKTQYSYTDGINSSVIDEWHQLSTADPDYNYVVTHHYYTDKYTGSQKKLNDPQVQFGSGVVSSTAAYNAAASQLQSAYQAYLNALQPYQQAQATFDASVQGLLVLDADGNYLLDANGNYILDITQYQTQRTGFLPDDATGTVSGSYYDSVNNTYMLSDGTNQTTYSQYPPTPALSPDPVLDALNEMIASNVNIDSDVLTRLTATPPDYSDIYFTTNANGDIEFAFKQDMDNVIQNGGNLPVYNTGMPTTSSTNNAVKDAVSNNYTTLTNAITAFNGDPAVLAYTAADTAYQNALTAFGALTQPSYIGNSELTYLQSLTDAQLQELTQIMETMQEEGISDSISDCFDANGNYIGGIYTFKMNGTTYYTTYSDLYDSYTSGTGHNQIDGQTKLAYYNATYISTKIETTEKALLETDENGRFSSVRFETDSATYVLKTETITDDAAYQDAMNQYNYDNALYDKTVQDINAKTSIIQRQDQQLELRLKQLDTEQKALSNEMEAVKKVIDSNVQDTFKTFGG